MAQSMAQMQQLLNSMTPEQRAQLQALAESLLEDMDLRWQVDQLARNLQQAFPHLPWERQMNFRGDDPLSMAQMPGLLDTLGDIDDLEHLLRQATQPGELAEVDLDQARELLGDDAAPLARAAAPSWRRCSRKPASSSSARAGSSSRHGRPRRIGQKALGDLFRKMMKDRPGRHEVERRRHRPRPRVRAQALRVGRPVPPQRRGDGQERDLAAGRRARRCGSQPDDFEVERTEHTTRSSTVLMLDVSLSMPMRDNFLPAKKVAMALHSLITSSSRATTSASSSFGRVAREVPAELLPEMSWDFEWGTNMQHALLLARKHAQQADAAPSR